MGLATSLGTRMQQSNARSEICDSNESAISDELPVVLMMLPAPLLAIINDYLFWKMSQVRVGDVVDCQDFLRVWYLARVIQKKEQAVLVSFLGWGEKWQATYPLPSEQLALKCSKVQNWDSYKVGDLIQVKYPRFDSVRARVHRVLNRKSKFGADLEVSFVDVPDKVCLHPGTHPLLVRCMSSCSVQMLLSGRQRMMSKNNLFTGQNRQGPYRNGPKLTAALA
jgi:hypothetical protein